MTTLLALDLVRTVCVWCRWVGALLYAQSHGAVHPAVPVMLGIGGWWADMRRLYRVQRSVVLRWIDPDGEEGHLPKDRTRVPLNVEFAIHRFNEFVRAIVHSKWGENLYGCAAAARCSAASCC